MVSLCSPVTFPLPRVNGVPLEMNSVYRSFDIYQSWGHSKRSRRGERGGGICILMQKVPLLLTTPYLVSGIGATSGQGREHFTHCITKQLLYTQPNSRVMSNQPCLSGERHLCQLNVLKIWPASVVYLIEHLPSMQNAVACGLESCPRQLIFFSGKSEPSFMGMVLHHHSFCI